jgi:archaellum biogenesis ATPase FlaH
MSDYDNAKSFGTSKITVDSLERQAIIARNETFDCVETGFMFLDDHFGLRNGCIHTLVGAMGKGKSSLTRSLLIEHLNKGKRILYYTTEETEEDFRLWAAYAGVGDDLLGNLVIATEKKMLSIIENPKEIRGFMNVLGGWVKGPQCDLIFFDNLTTSSCYDSNDATQSSKFIKALSLTIDHLKIPCLLVAHTNPNKKDSSNVWIDGSDIRGSRDASIISQYLYVMRALEVTDETTLPVRHVFIFTDKARRHPCGGRIYQLYWDKSRKRYTRDRRVSMEDFNAIYKTRNKIG